LTVIPCARDERLRAEIDRFAKVLKTQAKRLQWLASRRYEALGGAASVPEESDEDAEV
jgi:hypothetical protein